MLLFMQKGRTSTGEQSSTQGSREASPSSVIIVIVAMLHKFLNLTKQLLHLCADI